MKKIKDLIFTIQANIPNEIFFSDGDSIVQVVFLLGLTALTLIILNAAVFTRRMNRQLKLEIDFARARVSGDNDEFIEY